MTCMLQVLHEAKCVLLVIRLSVSGALYYALQESRIPRLKYLAAP